MIGFGDNSVDLELRFWIDDPSNGVGNVRSEVFLAIWDRFQKEGIEIPFPQRDIHISGLSNKTISTLQEEDHSQNTDPL
jgi:small-conductance mechanosensitive channel